MDVLVEPRAIAEETLACETNDGRLLVAHVERLVAELGAGLRARGQGARRLVLRATYVDGREAAAQRAFAEALRGGTELRAAAFALAERALARRVRVRRVRLEGWGIAPGARQLSLWDALGSVTACGAPADTPPRAEALEAALDRVRARFGSEALMPASWMALGVAGRLPGDRRALRAPARS